jgi:hypothetical protein
LAVSTDAGTTYPYDGGLDLSGWGQALEIGSTEPGSRQVALEVDWPGVAARVAAGLPLDLATGELSLHVPGETWEQRIVVLRGATWLPSYGTQDEAIALTVESPEYQDHGRLCEPNGVVSAVTLPAGTKPGDKVDGRVYPLVIGRPDWVPATVYDSVGNNVVVAAGIVDSTEVAVVHDDPASTGTTSDPSTIAQSRDNLGHVVSTAGYNPLIITSDTMEVVTRWMDGYSTGGGVISDHGSGYITGLGDVARWAMRRSTIPIDEGRWRAVEDRLNRWLVDYWTNDLELTPWAFVRDDLLPLVPVSILHGPRGLYPVWWPYDATGSHDRVAEVDVHVSGLERVGLVEHERRERPINELTMEYYPWQGDLWRYRLTYTGRDVDAVEAADTFLVQSSPLRAAYSRHHGERRAALVQSRAIYQRASAEMTLGWMQYARSRTPRVITYDDTRGRWAWLRPGAVVSLVDADLGIDRIAWVRRRAWSVDAVRLTFMVWDH